MATHLLGQLFTAESELDSEAAHQPGTHQGLVCSPGYSLCVPGSGVCQGWHVKL